MCLKNTCTVSVIMLFLACVPQCVAGIAISPAYVEANLDRGRPSGQFIVTNLGESEERFRIQAIHFVFTKDGMLQRIPPDKNSLAGWIKFNPSEFSLPPKSNRTIRYVIIPKGNLRAGEYWGAMELESLQSQEASAQDQNGHAMKIEVIASILVPIWGKVGNVHYQGVLKEASVAGPNQGQTLKLLLQNTGDGRLAMEKGEYIIRNSSGADVLKGTIGKFYLLPGQEQFAIKPLTSSLAPGNYLITIIFHSPQLKNLLQGNFPLELK